MTVLSRVTLIAAGVSGAVGVAAAAASAHGGDQRLMGAVALVALAHAPALLVLALVAPRRLPFRAASILLMVGVTLFCGDLALRAFAGHGLFALAAPTGGVALMLGWLAAGAGALFAGNQADKR